MVTQELTSGEMGAETDYMLELKDGKLMIKMDYTGKGGGAGVYAMLDPEYFMLKLAAAIPGEIDDAVIRLIIAAMKA